MYMFYINIKICIYHIVLKKSKHFINIYFELGLSEFQVGFDNIYTLLIILQSKKYTSIQVRLVSIRFRLNCHPNI
jgi:hypothetical protein